MATLTVLVQVGYIVLVYCRPQHGIQYAQKDLGNSAVLLVSCKEPFVIAREFNGSDKEGNSLLKGVAII